MNLSVDYSYMRISYCLRCTRCGSYDTCSVLFYCFPRCSFAPDILEPVFCHHGQTGFLAMSYCENNDNNQNPQKIDWKPWETQLNRLFECKDTIINNENTYAHTVMVAQSASWLLRILRTSTHFRWTARIYTCTY